MNINVTHYRRINDLIQLRVTGSPDELAKQVGISKRQLLKILKDMKESFNAPIKYNSMRKTYYYFEEGFFFFGFQRSKKAEITQAVVDALTKAMAVSPT
ncbi:hypothetical protein [Pedobacter sp. L105]|uniref:hypothetical protein n=1 Tax=Pedobacter sp. L105 TaxID=1641871 RepID=UPI00131AF25F|nr:hypothetical protein [Pedobacter sp. L105]